VLPPPLSNDGELLCPAKPSRVLNPILPSVFIIVLDTILVTPIATAFATAFQAFKCLFY
jgi:hypothetical protein